uniref:Uncharacterized protein n=1 Tax=Timema douglasi TaxID=61478 RepID=A0A7R8Z6Y2_TIMDO|nr:unnamed protein product [Timema douglasi]
MQVTKHSQLPVEQYRIPSIKRVARGPSNWYNGTAEGNWPKIHPLTRRKGQIPAAQHVRRVDRTVQCCNNEHIQIEGHSGQLSKIKVRREPRNPGLEEKKPPYLRQKAESIHEIHRTLGLKPPDRRIGNQHGHQPSQTNKMRVMVVQVHRSPYQVYEICHFDEGTPRRTLDQLPYCKPRAVEVHDRRSVDSRHDMRVEGDMREDRTRVLAATHPLSWLGQLRLTEARAKSEPQTPKENTVANLTWQTSAPGMFQLSLAITGTSAFGPERCSLPFLWASRDQLSVTVLELSGRSQDHDLSGIVEPPPSTPDTHESCLISPKSVSDTIPADNSDTSGVGELPVTVSALMCLIEKDMTKRAFRAVPSRIRQSFRTNGLDPRTLPKERSNWEERYITKEHRRAGKASSQGHVYNFLERPTGWKCLVYHVGVVATRHWAISPVDQDELRALSAAARECVASRPTLSYRLVVAEGREDKEGRY